MCELSRDDLVNILVALQSEVKTWQEFEKNDAIALPDEAALPGGRDPQREAMLAYDKEQVERFRATRNQVEQLLRTMPYAPPS